MKKIPLEKVFMAICFVLCWNGLSNPVQAQRNRMEPKLKRQKLTNGISILMPQTYREMTDDELAGKYFTYRKPVKMFTDDQGRGDIGVNYSATKWSYADLEILKDFYFATLSDMYSDMHVIEQGIRQHGNYRFAYFEFTADVRDDSKIVGRRSKPSYVYVMYTVQGDKVLLINYNCPKRYMRYQQKMVRQMMNSLKIVGKPTSHNR